MATLKYELPIPGHFNSANSFLPDYQPNALKLQQEAQKWRQRFKLHYVGSDQKKIYVLIIDDQYDFSFQSGTLFVGGRSGKGAMNDHDRLAQFIYSYLGDISGIIPTMDTHLPYQIFYPVAHLDQDGNYPAPGTIIGAEEYRKGKYHANPAMAVQIGADPFWLQKQFIFYCEELEKSGKYQLMIWPYHCMLGSNGHRLAGVIEEVRLFHSFARGAANIPEIKGGNPLFEEYSIFKPEVMFCFDGRPIPGAQKRTKLIKTILGGDMVIVAGQAASHCLAWTVKDLLDEILAQDTKLADKVYILKDCTSSVVIPGVIDFTDQTEKVFQNFADAGIHLVNSTDPIETWTGVNL